jgi:hypothetical protein
MALLIKSIPDGTKYGTRTVTAKTVNDELVSLVASCQRIAKRLLGKPGDAKLTELLAKQQAKLDAVIVAAQAGATWRHRGEIAGQRLDRFSARKAKVKAKRIVAQYPAKG